MLRLTGLLNRSGQDKATKTVGTHISRGKQNVNKKSVGVGGYQDVENMLQDNIIVKGQS